MVQEENSVFLSWVSPLLLTENASLLRHFCHQMWQFGGYLTKRISPSPAEYPTLELKADTTYPDTTSGPAGLGLGPTKVGTPPEMQIKAVRPHNFCPTWLHDHLPLRAHLLC